MGQLKSLSNADTGTIDFGTIKILGQLSHRDNWDLWTIEMISSDNWDIRTIDNPSSIISWDNWDRTTEILGQLRFWDNSHPRGIEILGQLRHPDNWDLRTIEMRSSDNDMGTIDNLRWIRSWDNWDRTTDILGQLRSLYNWDFETIHTLGDLRYWDNWHLGAIKTMGQLRLWAIRNHVLKSIFSLVSIRTFNSYQTFKYLSNSYTFLCGAVWTTW